VRILVADDNQDAAQTLATLLEMLGHQVQVAYDGAAALAAASAFAPEAMICDIGMPGLDGYTVASRLRESSGDATLPLMIACTGYGNSSDVRKSIDAGFDHHLTKPACIDDLLGFLDAANAAGGSTAVRTTAGKEGR
jgi:two-component system, sensor histidine kinase